MKKIVSHAATPHIAFVLMLLLMSVIFYDGVLYKLPMGIHDWAQGDRLSLAYGYFDNGLNFFKPATNSLFSEGGITGVEFPLQSYIAGMLGYVFGRSAINTCFRVEGVLIAWAGLYFLFRMVYDRTGDFFLSIIPALLIFCSPVFVFYSASYLPDPAGASISFIALYFLLKYVDGGRLRFLLVSLGLLTLAILVKASTAVCWPGVVCCGLYYEWLVRKNRRHAAVIIICALLSVIIVYADVRYIQYLNERYHSNLFLARTAPFPGWERFIDYVENTFKDTWMPEYFLMVEYPVFVFIIAAGIRAARRTNVPKIYLRLSLLFLPVAVLFFWLFGNQFFDHDYYVIGIFFPLIAYLLVVCVIAIHRRFAPVVLIAEIRLGLGCMLLLAFFLADHQISRRFSRVGVYKMYYSSDWVNGGAEILRKLHVPQEARILVAGDSPPNLSLLYFDRKGYVMPPDAFDGHLERATGFLRDHGMQVVIIREAIFQPIFNADSTHQFASYDVLWRGDNKVVLRLKNNR